MITNADKHHLRMGIEQFCESFANYAVEYKSILDVPLLKGELYTRLRRTFKFLTGSYKLSKDNIHFIGANWGCIEGVKFSVCYGQTATEQVVNELNNIFSEVNWDDLYQKAQVNLIINSVENFKIK